MHCSCRRYASCLAGPSKHWLADELHKSCADSAQQVQPDLSQMQQEVNAYMVNLLLVAQMIVFLPKAPVH